MPPKILIFCSDGIGLDYGFLTGGGLRSRQFVDALKPHFAVTFLEPNTARNKEMEIGYDVTVECQLNLIEKHAPDLVYFLNASAAVAAVGGQLKQPFCIDIHGPIHLESALINNTPVRHEANVLASTTENAALITVANDRQRYGYLYGGFMNHNHFMEARRVVTFPVYFFNDQLASKNETHSCFVYSVGGFYPWQNPKQPIESVIRYLPADCIFRVVGGPHAGLVNEAEINTFLKKISRHPQVEIFKQVPRAQLDDHLSLANLIIDLSQETSERSIAANTRVNEFLSLGIPVLVDDYSYYGEFLRGIGLGNLVVKDYGKDLEAKLQFFMSLTAAENRSFRAEVYEKYHAAEQFKSCQDKLVAAINRVLIR